MPELSPEVASIIRADSKQKQSAALVASGPRHERGTLGANRDSMAPVPSGEYRGLKGRGLPAENRTGLIDHDKGPGTPPH